MDSGIFLMCSVGDKAFASGFMQTRTSRVLEESEDSRGDGAARLGYRPMVGRRPAL